jgi:hypothetical protein
MARTKPKLWFAAAGGKPRLKISSADWQRIESAYERCLNSGGKFAPSRARFLTGLCLNTRFGPVRSDGEGQSLKAAHEFQK